MALLSGSYNVDSSQVSVSGISSGACMATQFHVAHSRDVMGVGLVAGGESTHTLVPTGTQHRRLYVQIRANTGFYILVYKSLMNSNVFFQC